MMRLPENRRREVAGPKTGHGGRRSRCGVPVFLAMLLLLCTSLPLYGDESSDLSSFLARIQHNSDQVRRFSTTFVQEKHLALFSAPVIFHGKLTVVRPDRLRWEFTDPVPSVLVFRGDAGLRCSDQAPPEKFSLGTDPVMRAVAEQLWLWLGGDYAKLQELYLLEQKGAATLRISPKQKSIAEYIAAVTISFDSELRQPESVAIEEPGGDYTLIIFQSYQINGEIGERLFTSCRVDD